MLCAALLLPATALAQGKVRYDEDWSQLADPAQRTGAWTERFKYIPLGDEAYLTTGVELRVRSEAYRGNLWGDLSDDQATWVRALPYADLHVAKTRVFVQPIAAYATGIEGPVDQTRVDLLQAFAETTLTAKGASLTLRAGRQMMPLGSERLVGTRYGPNVPLAFDGWRAIVRSGSASLSLLAAQPVAPGPDSFDDRRSRTKQLWGAYLTTSGLELYYLGYRNRAADWGGRQGRELRHSFGARWFGEHGGTHWNVEGVAQRGRFAGGTIGAWTLATEIGRRFPGPIEPDATLRISIASGDKNPHDKRLGTFNALFPKGKYFGELSPIGPYNIISANPQISAALAKDWSASLAAMAYWRFSRGDGIYDVPGNLIRTGDGAAARFIGKQAEAVLSWQATPELELSASLSAFAPGAFIRETGPHRTIAMLGFESEFRF
ncbi:MAG: alginate export family protein [Sphingomonas sp.]|uniref:alginate export family protein n=1 Tax=Sphingomonas sp. TaxID=28214 RepID=UPI001B1AE903|nr:alginate export family protein [Sphingomonas sp.]MBO9621245.1 alginate export family protein [Sphingomonas sp.]